MDKRWLAPAGLAAAALMIAACGSSSSLVKPGQRRVARRHGRRQRARGERQRAEDHDDRRGHRADQRSGFTLYWFVPDTATTSKCNGSCATYWPPVKGPATAGPGVTGKLATITRADGSTQATYNGHPLYTYKGDTGPGQASGNNLNASGGVWHEVTASGAAAPAPGTSTSSGGGYGY